MTLLSLWSWHVMRLSMASAPCSRAGETDSLHLPKNYSQLEKEALAIVSAVKKFHNYLYGCHFIIQSYHQPLSFLFHESKGIPQQASSRIQRWALTLTAYNYDIRYKAAKKLLNADVLSRLPRPVTADNAGQPADLIHLVYHLSSVQTHQRLDKQGCCFVSGEATAGQKAHREGSHAILQPGAEPARLGSRVIAHLSPV